jgi:Cys-tRNA(Pro)/Cys-tRNA(Cys) deacylase
MDQNTNNSTPVTRALDALNVPYRFFRHPGQVRSLEQAARERGQRPGQIVRSIVFRLSEDEFIMVLVAGPEQISWHDLREYLGLSRMTMANKEQVLEKTGSPPGAVSPFGLPQPMRILVDKSVLQEEIVSIGSGVRNTTVILRRDDLMQALEEVEIVTVTGSG